MGQGCSKRGQGWGQPLRRDQQGPGSHKAAEQRTGHQANCRGEARRSAEADLKNVQDQVEDQHKKLYLTDIELATQKQLVLDLKADLEKAKATARTAEEVVEASRQASYNLNVKETEIRLAEELAEVCRDYYKETWIEALNLAGVPVASEWRQAGSVYYPPAIHTLGSASSNVDTSSEVAELGKGSPTKVPPSSDRPSEEAQQYGVAEKEADANKGVTPDATKPPTVP